MKMLGDLRWKCRVITPMFLCGADGETPELRAPAIKGAMRYWWRAIQADSNLQRLKEREARIFGDVGNEGKSKFFIVVRPGAEKTAMQRLLPHHTGDWNCPYCSGRNGSSRCKKGVSKKAFSDQQEFEVILRYRSLPPDLSAEQLAALFELTSLLGGLGKRSRRGFGSFAIESGTEERDPLKRIFGLLETLADGTYALEGDRIKLAKPCHARYPFIRTIQVGRVYASAAELLKRIGQASHDAAYRSRQDDFPALGIVDRQLRLASPVYVSVVRSPEGLRPVITTLQGVFRNKVLDQETDRQRMFKEAIL